MRSDLLPVYACVEWAVHQTEILKNRILDWKYKRPFRLAVDNNSSYLPPYVRLVEVKKLPLTINVEAGMIINSLRSSLDLLCNVLATRNGHTAVKGLGFPISKDKENYLNGKNAGRKKITTLSNSDQKIIEGLEPWRNGNNRHLIALHFIDIKRKHQEIIKLKIIPEKFYTFSNSKVGLFEHVPVWPGLVEGGIIGHLKDRVDDIDLENLIQIDLDVVFIDQDNEHIKIITNQNIIEGLQQFITLTKSILDLFDA